MKKVFVKMKNADNSYTDISQNLVISGTQVKEVNKTQKIISGLAAGVIVEVSEKEAKAATPVQAPQKPSGNEPKTLDTMTYPELKAYAADKGIEIKGSPKQAALVQLIKDAEAGLVSGGSKEDDNAGADATQEDVEKTLNAMDDTALKAWMAEKAIEIPEGFEREAIIGLAIETLFPAE